MENPFIRTLRQLSRCSNSGSNANISILPTLSNQFDDLSINFVGDLLPDRFSTEQIALAFIAALGDEALQDFNGPLASLDFTDPFRPENPVRIALSPAVGAIPARLIRSNLMWVLRTLPIVLFESPSIWGLNFNVKYRGQNLYLGRLDNRNRPILTLDANKQTANVSSKVGREERALSERTSKNGTVSMNIPGQGNDLIDVNFHFIDSDRFVKTAIFTVILDLIFGLAPRQFSERVSSTYISEPNLPVWIFIAYNNAPTVTQRLHMFQVVALLQAVTQIYVREQIWQEMVFHLMIGGNIVAGGCVTLPEESRKWCAGMEPRGVGN